MRTQPRTAARIAALVIISNVMVKTAVALNSIQRRQGQCRSGGRTSCPPNVPFCCPLGTKCISLTADNTSVVCCPPGQDCINLSTIECNLSLQNENRYPNRIIHTKPGSHSGLPACGQQCCPFGYSCQVNGSGADATYFCKLERPPQNAPPQNAPPQNAPPQNAPPLVPSQTPQSSQKHKDTTTLPSKQSHTAAPTMPRTGAPQPTDPSKANNILPTDQAQSPPTSPEFPAKAVVLGLCVGLVTGIGLAILAWWLVRRRKGRKGKTPPRSQSPNLPKNVYEVDATSGVSSPVVATQFGGGHRTDFLLRTPDRKVGLGGESPSATRYASSTPRTPPRRPARSDELLLPPEKCGYRPQELDTKSSNTGNIHAAPSSPNFGTGRSDRVRSTETISVKLMPPPLMTTARGRGVSTNTTWSAMMEASGAKRSQEHPAGRDRWN